jgi:adenine-specific DNA-methyltransferase
LNSGGKINVSWPNAKIGPRYDVLHPKTKKAAKVPNNGWRYKRETFDSYLDYKNVVERYDGSYICGQMWFAKDEKTQPSFIKYLDSVNNLLFRSILSLKSSGGTELDEILPKNNFPHPKTYKLIKLLLQTINKDTSIVLDFMAGSGTTAHAVLQLNKEDNGNRKFILCTNNENNICTEVTQPRINKVIKGYTNVKNQVINGLGGNLQYLKTALIKKTKNRDQVKINLTKRCTELLCVKENIFNLEIENKDYKIFSSNNNGKHLCIYYNFIEDTFDDFLSELKKLTTKKIIYMFSLENELDKSIFSEIPNKKIEAIPQEILAIYKQLVKMNIPIKTNVIFTDLNKAKIKIFNDKDKDDGARVLRVVLEKLLQKISQDNSINILNAKGSEIKISVLNDQLFNTDIINKVEYADNKTYLTIGNNAAHGDYDDYNLKQVEKFYKHIQSLLNSYNV